MGYTKRVGSRSLVAIGLLLIVAGLARGEGYMVLRYDDGSSQRVKLERPSETIRQIEFTNDRRGAGQDRWARSGIDVISASYGQNCGASYGNVTAHLASACEGKAVCEYVVDVNVLGDPAYGCAKNYIAEWRCLEDGSRASVTVTPEAGNGKKAVLRCPAR